MMAAKRNPGRFTIQFNMNDPIHVVASTILDQQGRHKAQYIANAISFYQFHFDPGDTGPIAGEASSVETVLSESPTNYVEQFIETKDSYEKKDGLDAIFEGTELPAITNTLAAFGNK